MAGAAATDPVVAPRRYNTATIMAQQFDELISAGTAVISDVFDSLKLVPPVLDNALRPVGASVAFAGPAHT